MISKNDMELFKLKAEIAKTFSDPKRLMIINELRHGEKQVGELAQALKIPQAVVSRQLSILRNRGVVTPRRDGTNVYYNLSDLRIVEACDLVHQILLDRLQKNREYAEQLFNLVTVDRVANK
jgi:DNA-binding transcriptional ArsR family regulator